MSEPSTQTPVHSIQDLVEFFHRTNPHEKLLMGIELERCGVYRDSLEAVPYDTDTGYQAVFQKLHEEVGWEIEEEKEGLIFEMSRGKASMSIEPDGRPELAGSPRENLHELSREFRLHDNELREIGNMFNIGWLPIGLQPFQTDEQIKGIPKQRYKIFQDRFPGQWQKTFVMRENGIHINFSYVDDENMVRKAQTAFRVLPIVAAMYASSPFETGKLSPYLCLRRKNHYHPNAPERNAVPPHILEQSFSFEQWIEHYLDFPVILIAEEGKENYSPENLTFRQWMEGGHDGRKPTPFDFDQHVKCCWSDMRLRQSYIEYRVADSTPEPLAMSLPALMKGLVFDSESWDAVQELTKDWTYERVLEIDEQATKTGLQTEVDGKTLLTYAQELITIANEKLHGFQRTEATEDDETIYLAPLKEQIFIKEKSPAEEMRDLWEGEWNKNPARILEWCEAHA